MARKTIVLIGLGAAALAAAAVIVLQIFSTPEDAGPQESGDAEPRATP
jgi:hypothetical protein